MSERTYGGQTLADLTYMVEGSHYLSTHKYWIRDLIAAAEECEGLRADNADLEESLRVQKLHSDMLQRTINEQQEGLKECVKLRADKERLREALKRIDNNTRDPHWEARRALEETK